LAAEGGVRRAGEGVRIGVYVDAGRAFIDMFSGQQSQTPFFVIQSRWGEERWTDGNAQIALLGFLEVPPQSIW